ncbi:MAG: hypothetical protein ACRC1H_11390, partial [Caldilineaceae bacterium]
QSGVLEEDSTGFVEGMRLLLDDEPLRHRMAAAAVRLAEEYKVETTAQRMSDLYASLVQSHGAPRDLSSLAAFRAARKVRERAAPRSRLAA